jgi:hypothetical protein
MENNRRPAIKRIVRKFIAAIVEMHEAQRWAFALRLAPERQVFAPERAPNTYADFLFRTSGPLPHEPSARNRAARQHGLTC